MKNSEQMEREFLEVEQNIRRLKAAGMTLNKLFQELPQDEALFESEMKPVRKKLKDLSKVDEVERDVEDMAKDVAEYRHARDEIIDMIANALSGKDEITKEGDRT